MYFSVINLYLLPDISCQLYRVLEGSKNFFFHSFAGSQEITRITLQIVVLILCSKPKGPLVDAEEVEP